MQPCMMIHYPWDFEETQLLVERLGNTGVVIRERGEGIEGQGPSRDRAAVGHQDKGKTKVGAPSKKNTKEL